MMAGRGERNELPAGGPARHIPVLLREAVAALRPHDGGLYIDGTFGAGGYTRALLAEPGVRVLAFDRDPNAISAGAGLVAASGGRLTLIEARFGDLAAETRKRGVSKVDGVALDIGVSSMQFDEADRGFSFRFDGPLDMRMEGKGRSAADIVNGGPKSDRRHPLLLRRGARLAPHRALHYRRAREAADRHDALRSPISCSAPFPASRMKSIRRRARSRRCASRSTTNWANWCARSPAPKTFCAEGGALAVVTFHSLEDRIVKQFFAQRSGRGAAARACCRANPRRSRRHS